MRMDQPVLLCPACVDRKKPPILKNWRNMQHKQQKQERSARTRNIVKYFKEHAVINGYLYFELIGSLTEQNDSDPKALLTKLVITTICQIAVKCFKSPPRNDDENSKK